MATKIVICLLIFLAYLFNKLLITPKLKNKNLATVIDLFLVLIVIPSSLTLLEPVLFRERIQKDEEFKKKLLTAVHEQNVQLENYKNRIAELHKQEFKSSSEDAEEWATNFLASLKIRQDKIKQIQEEEIIKYRKELIKLPILFDFILHDFDSKASAFLNRFPDTKFMSVEKYDLMVDSELSEKKDLLIRKLTFENGNSIELILEQGTLEKQKIKSYPKIYCSETTKNVRQISFTIHKHTGLGSITRGPRPLIGNISYTLHEDSFITNGFRKDISAAYQKAIETVYLR